MTKSLIALINGEFENLKDEFFAILKVNPSGIKHAR